MTNSGIALAIGVSTALAAATFGGQLSAQAATTPATLSGQATQTSGAESGATIAFIAWPNSDTLALNGDPALVSVGSTTTDSTGSWSYTPKLSSLGSSYFETDGSVSIEADITSLNGAYEQDYSTSIAAAANGDPDVASPSNPETINSNFSAQQVTATMGGVADTESDQVSSAAANNAGATPDPGGPVPPYCGKMTYANSYKDQPEKFLNLGTDDGVTSVVNETIQSKHKVGLGADITGDGWGVSGTVSISSSKASSAKVNYGHSEALYNDINYNTYTQTCHGGSKNGTSHYTHPTGMYALQDPNPSYNIQTPLYNNCTSYTTGTYTKSNGKGQDFATGITLPFVSLSSQSAYTTNSSTAWTFHGNKRQLCGNNDGWASASTASAYLESNSGGCVVGKPCGITDGVKP